MKNLLLECPEIAAQWDYDQNGELLPENVSPGSDKKVWWVCSKGHKWVARIANRHLLGRGCPYCCGQKACPDNCLAMLRPDLAKEWSDKNTISAFDITVNSGKKFWWVCEKGHKWVSSVDKRNKGTNRNKGTGCPYCAGKKVCEDNCLATLRPNLIKEWSDENILSPYDVTLKSGKKVWWVCKNGHTWKSAISDRTDGRNCPYCSKRVSKKSITWLDALEIDEREKYINIDGRKFYVDGIKDNIIYEFLGNYWHGNPFYYGPDLINKCIKKTFGELLYNTIERLNSLTNGGYTIIYKWENQVENKYSIINKNQDEIIKKANIINKNKTYIDILQERI
jgi:hypothetical protein